MDGKINAKYLSAFQLNYIISANDITPKTMPLRVKERFAQEIIDSAKWPECLNSKFDIDKLKQTIKNTCKDLDTSVVAFTGLQSDPLCTEISNRLKFLNQCINFQVPDEPENLKRQLSYFKDICQARYYDIKAKFNGKAMKVAGIQCGDLEIYNKPDENDKVITSRFSDDFDVVGLLGKGGFGVVFEVIHKIDGQHYAIKIEENRIE